METTERRHGRDRAGFALAATGILVALATATWVEPVGGQHTPLKPDDRAWVLTEDSEVGRAQGRDVIRIRNGRAIRPDIRLAEGTVEFDMWVHDVRSFVGITFRGRGAEPHEDVYLRPHKSGLPDAIQYTPRFDGQGQWQLYHGPHATAPAGFTPGEWQRVRLIVEGERAAVFVGDVAEPQLLIDELRSDGRQGTLGFWAAQPGAGPDDPWTVLLSDIVVRPGEVEWDFPPAESEPSPPGVVRAWALSETFVRHGEDVLELPEEVTSGSWHPVETEPSGLLPIERHVERPTEGTPAVLARLDLETTRPRTVRLDLGFSDRASVFLNGRLVYSGRHDYSNNFPRRQGLITLDQAALHLPLDAGTNRVVVAVSETFGGWGLMGRIVDREGLRVTPGGGGGPEASGGSAGPSVGDAPTGTARRPTEDPTPDATLPFHEDFENGLGGWTFPLGEAGRLVDSGDPERGAVLSLRTGAHPSYALIEGSEAWGDIRMEGLVLFPEDVHNYLGFIYRYRDDGRRLDFGSLYIKGNGSYIRANPHHDTNVGRVLYEELRTPLEGASAIEIGTWTPFALEVVGPVAHLYVGDTREPRITFDLWDGPDTGAFGFKPRNPGGAVWVDDLRVTGIDDFTYRGPSRPRIEYRAEEMLTEWHVLGPLAGFAPEVERGEFDPGLTVRDDGRSVGWRDFDTDPRGAVITGEVTEYRGGRRVAYFHTVLEADRAGAATLELATADDLAIWLNGRFVGYGTRDRFAWWDAATNPDHRALRARLELRAGENHLVLRALGGTYATGGFFARLAPEGTGARP